MKLSHFVSTSVLFSLVFTSGVALAQGTTGPTSPQGGAEPSHGGMGMMGGMSQAGGAAPSGAAQASSGQGGCPMMRNMASLQERVRQLEQRAGIPSPAQPQ